MQHDIAVPDANGPGGLVMTSRRVGKAAEQAVSGFRFVDLRSGSLREILRLARRAEYNLGHIPAVRCANQAFFYLVTVPVLALAWLGEWVHVRMHRALAVWGVVLVFTHYLNRIADWLIPDILDLGTWSATMWQIVGGWAILFVIFTFVIYLRGR